MRRGPWLVSSALALLALGPVLALGYTLTYDMVFVPRLDLGRDDVGLGDGLPRAVPVDAVVAAVTQVVPGQVLQKAVLLATLVLAGAGAGRLAAMLLPGTRGPPRRWPPRRTSGIPTSPSGCSSGTGRCSSPTPPCRGLVTAAHGARGGDGRGRSPGSSSCSGWRPHLDRGCWAPAWCACVLGRALAGARGSPRPPGSCSTRLVGPRPVSTTVSRRGGPGQRGGRLRRARLRRLGPAGAVAGLVAGVERRRRPGVAGDRTR